MWKKILLLLVWLSGSVATLLFSLQVFSYQMLVEAQLVSPSVLGDATAVIARQTPELLYAAVALPKNTITATVGAADARAEILRQYLSKHESPLEPHAGLLVTMADENGFDFRWMVAIAQQESNLCRHIPENSFNCWGWGIYGDKVTRFASYDDAIRRIAPQFRKRFLKTSPDIAPEDVMKTYTPPSDGSWAFGVNQFMEEME